MTVNLTAAEPHLLAGLVQKEADELPKHPFAAINNSFGFGGTNASLVVATAPQN